MKRGSVVLLVVTEHPSYLTPERRVLHAKLANLLADLSGLTVESIDYLKVGARGPQPVAIVVGGSVAPWSTHDRAKLERVGDYVATANVPTLGICAGMQLLAEFAGGRVERADHGEFGYRRLEIASHDDLFAGLGSSTTMYQEHTDRVSEIPTEMRVLAASDVCIQAFVSKDKPIWGTQFHPERANATHPDGTRVLRNFLDLALGRRRAGREINDCRTRPRAPSAASGKARVPNGW